AARRAARTVSRRRTVHAVQTVARSARISDGLRHRAPEPAGHWPHLSLSNRRRALVPRHLYGWPLASTRSAADRLRALDRMVGWRYAGDRYRRLQRGRL